jgi:glycosyltransferase involved in cell wall biosynthesis
MVRTKNMSTSREASVGANSRPDLPVSSATPEAAGPDSAKDEFSGRGLAGQTLITVIVICRNEEGYIDNCLQGISAQAAVPGDLEILVVDGMSTDRTREIVARWSARDSRIRLLDNPRQIVPTGLNEGIRQARGDFVAIISAHAQYASDYLSECLRIQRETGADNVGGPAQAAGRTPRQQAIALAFNSPYSSGGARWHDLDFAGEVDTTSTGFYRRSKLMELGLYDEELVRNQDDELNLRLTRAGGRIYQSPTIRYRYFPRDSLSRLYRQYFQYGYWKVRVIQKHRLPASIRHLVPVAAVLLGVALALAGFWSAKAWATLGVLAALYLGGILIVTLGICRRQRSWRLAPGLAAAFICCHSGYGFGFLLGIVDFVVLRRRGRQGLGVLTR